MTPPSKPVVFESLESIKLPNAKPVVLTIGTFDGFHRGHQALLREAKARAAKIGDALTAVLTFQNHPRSVLEEGGGPLLLSNWELKKALVISHGPDIVTGLRFDRALAQTPAEDFVRDVILGRFGAKVVISGPGFHFGHDREGNPALLTHLAGEWGFEYFCHPQVLHRGEAVSSTRIRRLVAEGNVAMADALMSRPHRILGTVVTGDRIGRTIGYPTANLSVEPGILLPADGVYVVRVHHNENTLGGMMNIGWRPTVGGREHRVEVHLFGFSGELAGERLAVDFLDRLRGEKRFNNLDDLRTQLDIDREKAIAFLGETLF